ncbi:MAG: glycosyltransferase family 4 protein [Chitinophagaceae bacterium]|nr:glycosyltransferase family 4 protein [Chitinophagaceae bacterium]
MKKVLVIAPYPYLPFFSGGQKFIAKFLEYLSNETDLTVISTDDNDWSLVKNYQSRPLLKKSFSRYMDRTLVKKITAIVKKENFDTLVCEHPYFAWLAFRIRKRTRIKVIIHTHNIEYQRFRSLGKWWWPLLKRYEKWSFQKADGLFFITPEDKNFAITNWGIAADKCRDVPFGIELKSFPENRKECRKIISARHGIKEEEKIFSFNGLLDYKPNLDALNVILHEINPLLLKQDGFRYKIIISGKRLPEELNSLKDYADKNIIYTGFTEDITTYLEATDIFLNPVQSGGGVKTKMVEAIGYGTTVVSTQSGATGISKSICGNKLIIVPDNDWKIFTEAICAHSENKDITPQEFYDTYYWSNIVKNLVR